MISLAQEVLQEKNRRAEKEERDMIRLNIYEEGKVRKTYETEKGRILYGTIEDLAGAIDPDKITEGKDGRLELGKSVLKVIPLVRPMLKEIFPGITDEEIRKTDLKEMISVITELIKYETDQLLSIGDSEGN